MCSVPRSRPGGLCDRIDGPEKGYKRVVTLTWKYTAGQQTVERASKEAFEQGQEGRQGHDPAVPERRVPAFLTGSPRSKPDAVFVFFAGAGAAKFVKDYAAAS